MSPTIELRVMGFQTAHHYISHMLEAHYKEVGNTKLFQLNPDWSKYEAIAEQGNFLAIVCMLGPVAIGYSVNFLSVHPHYANQLICYNDLIFVAKDFRESSAGSRLLRATKRVAKHMGANVMQWHAKPGTALDRTLAKRMPIFEHAYTEAL